MAEPQSAPPPEDNNLAPWEREAKKHEGRVPGGPATGWHESGRKAKTKRSQIVIAVMLFFGLAGLLLALFLKLKDPVPPIELLAIPVSQYRNIEWASNPTADRDADELLKHFEQAGGRAAAAQQSDKLRKLLANPNDSELRQNPGAPFVLFVSALAITRDGKAYILPGDARLESTETWIPFSEVLVAMDKCAAEHKALLVDLARSPADPFHGPLHDDVQAQIDRELTTFAPKFPVLASCSPGERSLVIPERRLSAFAAFLAEGLGGEADGYRPNEQPDNRITFDEVALFTIARVSQWADGVPDARQMPKRYGPDGLTFLLYRDRTRNPPPVEDTPPLAAPPGYPAELLDGWKQRDSFRDLGTLFAPDLVCDLESRLLRAESRYLAGLDVDDPRQDAVWKTTIARLRLRTTLIQPLRPSTLIELRTGRLVPKPEFGFALDKWLKLRFPAKDDSGKPIPVPQTELDKYEAEMRTLLTNDVLVDAHRHFWQRLVEDPTPTAEKVSNIATLLEDARFAQLPVTGERLLVRRLAATKLPGFAYPDAVRAMLQAEQMFGEAMAALGGRIPEGFERASKIIEAADVRKQKAEEVIFKPRATSDEIDAARQQFQLATEELKTVRNGAVAARNAHRAVAETAAALHASLPAVIAWNKPDADTWSTAAKLATDLAARLAIDGPFEPREFEELDAMAKRLRAAGALLVTHTPGQLKKLEEDANKRPEASTYSELQKLLAGAMLAADDRAGIAAGFRKVSAARYWAQRAKFDKEHIRTPVEHIKLEDPFLRSQRRAGGSVELLRLAGLPSARELSLMQQTAGSGEAKWQSLSDRSLAEWRTAAPDLAAIDVKKNQWRGVERILRAAPPRLDGFNREVGFGKLFDSEEIARRKWLAARFGEYGKLRKDVLGAAAFYSELSEDCDRPHVRVGR